MPLPSQRNADVSVDPVHPISLQTVPAGYLSHAPVPSHMPVEPHVDAASTAHSSRGSVPSWALTQVPTVPWPAHVTQVPAQALLQQTPSAQNPLAHSPPIAHELPIGLPGASMPTSAGRSTDTSPGDPSVAASPGRRIARDIRAGVRDTLLAAAAASRDPRDRAQGQRDQDEVVDPGLTHTHPRGQEERVRRFPTAIAK